MKELWQTIKEKTKAYFQEMKDAMAPMTPKERVIHFWEYYRVWVWALVVLIVIGCIIGTSIHNSRIHVLISGSLPNVNITAEGETFLTDEYLAAQNGNPKKDSVELTVPYFGSLETSEDPEYSYNAAMGVLAMVAAQSLDYMMMDDYALQLYLGQNMFLDLREFFTPEELEEWKDRMIYYVPVASEDLELEEPGKEKQTHELTEEEKEKMYPVAIRLEDTAFAKKYLKGGPYYLSFVINSKNSEDFRTFWNYLMSVD